MKLEQGKFCPLIGEDCLGLKCSWFTQIRGTHPQTGQEIDEWGCAVTWIPTLLIENSQQQRQTGAAVESFRNETLSRISQTISMKKIDEPINECFTVVVVYTTVAFHSKVYVSKTGYFLKKHRLPFFNYGRFPSRF